MKENFFWVQRTIKWQNTIVSQLFEKEYFFQDIRFLFLIPTIRSSSSVMSRDTLHKHKNQVQILICYVVVTQDLPLETPHHHLITVNWLCFLAQREGKRPLRIIFVLIKMLDLVKLKKKIFPCPSSKVFRLVVR